MDKTLLYLALAVVVAAEEAAEKDEAPFTADFAFLGRMGITAIVIIKLLGLVLVEKMGVMKQLWAKNKVAAYAVIGMLVFVIVIEVGDNVAEMVFALDEAAETHGYEKWIRTFSYYSSFVVTAGVSLALIQQSDVHCLHGAGQKIFLLFILIGGCVLTAVDMPQATELVFAVMITLQLALWVFIKGKSLPWMVPAQVVVMLIVLYATASLHKDNPALDSLRAATLSIKALTLEPMLGLFFETCEDDLEEAEKEGEEQEPAKVALAAV